jgi:hypothetical protein
MKVTQEFAPISITFDDEQEFLMFWEIIEETHLNCSYGEKRDFLISLSDMLSIRNESQSSI